MKFSPFCNILSAKSQRNNHVFRSSRTDPLGENGPLPRFYPRTGYRITNSSTFFFMVACSDFKAEYSLDKSRCRVSSSRSDAMSRVRFRVVRDSPAQPSVLKLAPQFRAQRGSVEGLSLRGTVAFKGAAERCYKETVELYSFLRVAAEITFAGLHHLSLMVRVPCG